MDSLHMDSLQRCVRHPRQRVVGVCAACLRERLSALADYSRLADAQIFENLSGGSHESLQVPCQTIRHAPSQAAASQAEASDTVDKEISEKNVPHSDKRADCSRRCAAVRRLLDVEETATMKARTSGCSSSQSKKTELYCMSTGDNRDAQVQQACVKSPQQACVKSPQRVREPCNVSQQAPDLGSEQQGVEIEVVKKELEVQGPAPTVRFLLHEHPSRAVAINAHGDDEEEDVGGGSDQGDKCPVDAVPTGIMQDWSDRNAAGDISMTSYARRSTDGMHVGRKSTDGVIKRPSFGLGIDRNDDNLCSSSRKKKTGSWFSLSKSKSVAQQSQASKLSIKIPSYVDQNGVLLASTPARRSTSDHRSQLPHHDLDSIAEGDVSTSSWISSLFHMKRSLKARSSKSMPGDAAAIEASTMNYVRNGVSVHQSPKVSIDAGRLSWDGPRSNIGHILKKIETRNHNSKLHSTINRSSHAINHQSNNTAILNASKPGNDVTLGSLLSGATANHPFISSLPKCKSVNSSRSDTTVDIPELITSENGGSSVDNQDYQSLARSRNVGHRGWTKALSPLLGRRQQTQAAGPTCKG